MTTFPKYKSSEPIQFDDRTWPSRRIITPPIWCPVDLRDGNQAFANPMDVETKIRYFKMLTDIGFKDIELAYPAASSEEFEFVRRLIEDNLIPDDVIISVFTAAKENLIRRTVESLKGCKRASVHCYIATSELHHQFVFRKNEQEIINIATDGTKMIAAAVEEAGLRNRIRYQFSPEEFSDSRLGFIVDLASAVQETWNPATKNDFIINLPATVERKPPYEYADMIETFIRHFPGMNRATLSVHTHNDQGGAITSAEMAILAGAERVEGTLCGHGERTGNMDLITFALNLKSRGIEPGLDFSSLPEIVRFIEQASDIRTHPRAPYTGELVFTAFSGTHQDAISKGMAQRDIISQHFEQGWKMPYLHIDPMDIGRNHEGIIRINSQSGKGGIAYVLEKVYNISIPRQMQPQVASHVQTMAESRKRELSSEEIFATFKKEFVNVTSQISVYDFQIRRPSAEDADCTGVELNISLNEKTYKVSGKGTGPIEAIVSAIQKCPEIPEFHLESYNEHALKDGADAEAIAYIGIKFPGSSVCTYGSGIDRNINIAALNGIVSALNRKCL